MQAPTPPLLPLLRSRLQADMLTLVLLTPGREWSLTELADRTGASLSSAQLEMARAQEADIVASHRLGSTRLVTAAESPLQCGAPRQHRLPAATRGDLHVRGCTCGRTASSAPS